MNNNIYNTIKEFGINNPSVSIRKTSEILGVPKSIVEKIYSEIRPKKELLKLDVNYFENIDSENKAYWLGFLYADCGISIRSEGKIDFDLQLQYDDYNHLVKFKNDIGYSGDIKEKTIKDKYKICRISISRYDFCKHIVNQGCVPKKSLILERPKNISDDLVKHFIRGYFDGDGCLCITDKTFISSMLGTDDVLNYIYEHISKNIDLSFGKNVYEDKRSKIKELRFHKQDTIKFMNYIYEDSKIYLDRKYKLYYNNCR